MKIGILLGDDIGLEVVPECVKVMKAAAARERLAIDWQELPIGKRGHQQHGNTLPAATEGVPYVSAPVWYVHSVSPVRANSATSRPVRATVNSRRPSLDGLA